MNWKKFRQGEIKKDLHHMKSEFELFENCRAAEHSLLQIQFYIEVFLNDSFLFITFNIHNYFDNTIT